MRILLNPTYGSCESFVTALTEPGWFDTHGAPLYEECTAVRVFVAGGLRLVVRRYGHTSLADRLHPGRAMRDYRNAMKLRRLGIETPEAVAAVEVRRRGSSRCGYFVSLYSDFRPLPRLHDFNTFLLPDARRMMDALAAFLLRMHGAGVLHGDLDHRHILYAVGDRGIRFQLVGISRTTFHGPLSRRRRLRDLRRLDCCANAYLYLLKRYAELGGAAPASVLMEGTVLRLLSGWQRRFLHKLKKLFRFRPGR